MEELKRMPISTLDAVDGSIDWTKEEIDQIWEKVRRAFEIF